MNKYELMYILVNTGNDEEKDAMIEKVNALITKNGGIVESVEKIGNKKLAYEIKKSREAHYVLINFEAKPEFIKELERVYRITDEVLKFIVVRKEN